MPIKWILMGYPLNEVANRASVANPEALAFFERAGGRPAVTHACPRYARMERQRPVPQPVFKTGEVW